VTAPAHVTAFRLAGHHLDRRRPADALASVVGAIGIRDVHGAGPVALHARMEGVSPGTIDDAVAGGTLVRVASARGVETVVPADDVAVFTVGTVPVGDDSLRARLGPFLADLDASGHTAGEALDLAAEVARQALAAGPLDIAGLSGAMTGALPELSPMCRGRCGRHHIDQLLFDLVGQAGVWRVDRRSGERRFVAMDPGGASAASSRAELVRRYLRCYGPSTVRHFAEWCGIGTDDAARSLAEGATTETARRTYALTDDLARLASPPEPTGVRFLPPHDPYLLGRDRAAVVADRDVQRRIWRAIPTDGVVLHDGTVVATWRTRKQRGSPSLVVDATRRLGRTVRVAIDDELAAVTAVKSTSAR
jgi:hypothetical protein